MCIFCFAAGIAFILYACCALSSRISRFEERQEDQ